MLLRTMFLESAYPGSQYSWICCADVAIVWGLTYMLGEGWKERSRADRCRAWSEGNELLGSGHLLPS